MPKSTTHATVVAAVLACVLLVGCAAPLSGPSAVVQKALELRRDRVTDVKSYDPLFTDASIGAQLAKDSVSATQVPLPAWSRPYVSRSTTSSAMVVVVWSHDDARFKDWPKATLFSVRLDQGAWRIADATSETGTVPPPAGASGAVAP